MCLKKDFRSLPALLIIVFFASFANAQNYGKYWVFFKDKPTESFDPYTYFDEKALERRQKHALPAYDFSDLPVDEAYIKAISGIADSIGFVSRWFNGMVFYGNSQQLEEVKGLGFVLETFEAARGNAMLASVDETPGELYEDLSEEEKTLMENQLLSLGSEEFKRSNIDGKGIRIAVFDAGFPGVDNHPAFEHIRKENRIVKTYDFIRKREKVYGANSHGTMVLSCIAGMADGKNIGLATGAEFLLARTERAFMEPFSEEEHWMAAAEWADKNGADIINSSLGYTRHRYFREQMDGSSLVARAASMAVAKGMLVVNAAGNDGHEDWKIIGTPADADSVLAVGGIDPETFFHVYFSSFGPTARQLMKPNVCSYGVVIAANARKLTKTQGTSFASPLIAGFAACAMQLKPGLKAMELFREIEKSGDFYPYYDYAHGFGIPRAAYFTGNLTESPKTLDLTVDKFSVKVQVKPEFMPQDDSPEVPLKEGSREIVSKPYESQRKHYFYYHIEGQNGVLEKYYIVEVESQEVLKLPVSDFKSGQTLRVHYRGYTQSHNF